MDAAGLVDQAHQDAFGTLVAGQLRDADVKCRCRDQCRLRIPGRLLGVDMTLQLVELFWGTALGRLNDQGGLDHLPQGEDLTDVLEPQFVLEEQCLGPPLSREDVLLEAPAQ